MLTKKHHIKALCLGALTALALASCAPASTPPPTATAPIPTEVQAAPVTSTAPAADAVVVATDVATVATAAISETATPAMPEPSWFSQPLTDVSTGQTFTLQALRGKVVLVEAMAQWCSNCKQQQEQVKALHNALGERDDFVSIGLEVDPNAQASDLQAYITRNGFDWRYAVSPAEVSRELGNLYTAQFLNPPATPILLVDKQGVVQVLPFGIKSATDLQSFVEPLLAQ